MSETHTSTADHCEPEIYEIHIKGHLDNRWADWFGNLTITLEADGNTRLIGPVVDQAALHGLLRRVRDLGMPLIAVIRIDPDPCHYRQKENNMTSNVSYRRTAILVASLWLLTAFGAIAGTALMNTVLLAPDYLTAVFPKSTTVISGMLLWLINDFGIVFIGVLMFPILKKRSESMALAYVSMRIFEAIFLVVGVIFAMLLIPLSQAFIKAGTTDVTSYQAVGSVLKQAEYWFMTPMQLIPLGIGGVILTSMLYQTKLVPRIISVVGIIGYALLLPSAILTLLGILDTLPGAPGSILVVPVAVFEIILMPIWLFAKGFNTSAIASKPSTPVTNELLSMA